MSPKSFVHQTHGDSLHDLAIFLAQRLIVNRSGKGREYFLLDGRFFADKGISPAIPDIYFQLQDNYKNQSGRRINNTEKYVVEMESAPSAASIAKKHEHFLTNYKGLTDLIIIDLSECDEPTNWLKLEKFLDERIP